MDVVNLVKEGSGRFEWSTVTSKKAGFELEIKVFRDAMKFDGVPNMKYNRTGSFGTTKDGVRLPANAYELQQIADLLNCMLMTPKVIDMIWLQAEAKFDAVVNSGPPRYDIMATMDIHTAHDAIEKSLAKAGDNGKKLVSCVGKYWCLMNELEHKGMLHGAWTACNYGWFAKNASGPGISPGTSCWQRPGFRHGGNHLDPSQTIRLMHRVATLHHPNGKSEKIDLHELAGNPQLAGLLHHQGELKYLRQKGPEKLEPLMDPSLDSDMWTLVLKESVFM